MHRNAGAVARAVILSVSLFGGAHASLAQSGDAWGARVADPGAAATQAAPGSGVTVATPAFSGTTAATLVRIELSGPVSPDVFTLAGPFRVIVDVPGGVIAKPAKSGTRGHGLIESYQSGRLAADKSRIVLETLGPVQATAFPLAAAADGKGQVLEIALTPMSVNDFGQGTGADRNVAPAATAATPARPGAVPDFGALSGAVNIPAMPVIVIDPGHGGIDPGAVAAQNLREKDIVIAVARKLSEVLSAKGRYRVELTRQDDVFVSLDQRLKMSREHRANLFISIHADSIENATGGQAISGATVYTLSERASDEQARKMAEKENAADLLAGIPVSTDADDDVTDILIDLMKRETASFSAEFSRVLIGKLKNNVQLSRDPARYAAFKVLKQTHAPSVLVELGYMSNPEEAKRLNSPRWQAKVATAIAAAVDAYFANRTTGSQ